MVEKLILILGDQLTEDISSLRELDPGKDVIIMAEVLGEASYVAHHPKKIILIFSAMRSFSDKLRSLGYRVEYSFFDDPQNTQSLSGELIRRSEQFKCSKVTVTQPNEWRVIEDLSNVPLTVEFKEDNRFISQISEFNDWAEGRKQLRMEYFYRDMRRKTGLLMDGEKPVGGKWNYDQENRKPAPDSVLHTGPKFFSNTEHTKSVINLVSERFSENFGNIANFNFATTQSQAEEALDHFIDKALPDFGAYQDAMMMDQPFLFHAIISPYLNIGLLKPLDVCKKAEKAFLDGRAPLNSVEGFIRQIIGWREYIRGIYFLQGPNYTQNNYLDHNRPLPSLYWGKESGLNCLDQCVKQTEEFSYAHHIQRLMVTGNFALLTGVSPYEVHEWYLSVYIDAFEWVEAPNTIGMSQFADGGVVASKPYVSSGAYINKMSNYCKSCKFKVSEKVGKDACPFNALYWHFLSRNRDKFQGNPRMAQMYRTWDRMNEDHKNNVIKSADEFLNGLN